jgi:Rab-GTPase-TBC domain
MTSLLESTDLMRRSYSLPTTRENNSSPTAAQQAQEMRHSKSEDNAAAAAVVTPHKLDRYGFILNMDSHGNVQDDSSDVEFNTFDSPVNATAAKSADHIPTFAEAARTERRVKKWETMLAKWSIYNSRRHRLIEKRLRKGIPDSLRATVWPVLCNVEEKLKQNPGLYRELVEKSVGGAAAVVSKAKTTNGTSSSHGGTTAAVNNGGSSDKPKESVQADTNNNKKHAVVAFNYSKSFKNIQDTIERDIHRTFPRHSLFYDKDEVDEAEGNSNVPSDDDTEFLQKGICGTTEISSMIKELELAQRTTAEVGTTAADDGGGHLIRTGNANGDMVNQTKILEGVGGQSKLRRVLKAYSTYDREIGYCQGMNFIAAMFLTLVSEEQAFWMLVCK